MPEQPFLPFDEPEPRPAQPRERLRETSATATGAPAGLIASLAAACRAAPLEEKVLVAPSLAVGHTLVERLAREGSPWLHLRVETARTIALEIVGPALAREGLRLLSRAQALALVEQACTETLSPDSYFGPLRDQPGFHRALQRTFDEIRAAGLTAAALPARAFGDARKVKELKRILARYDEDLARGGFIDGASVLRRALGVAERDASRARYLVVDGVETSPVERRLIEKVAGDGLEILAAEPVERWTEVARGARLLRATGEENEIREVFRRALADGIPFDEIEVLHTDADAYPALVWELAREHDVPVTFSGGVAVPFTHPGQAALAFLDWIAAGFEAEVLRKSLAAGALTFERRPRRAGEASGTRAVARAFREAQIGWGAARHRTALDRLIAELERPEAPRREDDAGESERAERIGRRERRLAAAREARRFADRAVDLAASGAGESCDLRAMASGCRGFVVEFARVAGELDATALSALESLFEELAVLPASRLPPAEAAARLADAVRGLAVDASRPRPGRVHVADFRSGGFSGRRHTFLLGLDEARHPGADLEDPVLLDSERREINRLAGPAALPLHRDRPRESARALEATVARLAGGLTASYSSWNLRSLDQQSEQFPSPFFLDLYRVRSGRPEADYSAMLRALPEAAGFLPGTARALDDAEWWLSRLEAEAPSAAGAAEAVRALYPHLEDGARAEQARQSDDFTVWDGGIRGGAPELDPRENGEPQSASRLETLARCPYKYFLQHVLRLEPPKELERDTTEWLDAMTAGSLLHEVFREFFERITRDGEKPEVARHAALLEAIAEERIADFRERIPPASELAFGQRRDDILVACRTFLLLEEAHCREVSPRWFEVPFGLPRAETRAAIASPEPVAIPISAAASFLLRGSIDRVDEAPDGSFHVWDYKTGGAWRHKEGRGIAGGRQIQHALYALALEALLARAGIDGSVSRSGYFFPGRKGEGLRMPMALDDRATRSVLVRLFDLLRAGSFPHATDRDDCRYCDFEAVCGGAARSAEAASRKLEKSTLPALRAFREIDGEI